VHFFLFVKNVLIFIVQSLDNENNYLNPDIFLMCSLNGTHFIFIGQKNRSLFSACALPQVGTLLASHCDKYVKSVYPGYEDGKLTRIITNSKCCKARLLHYFGLTDRGQTECRVDSWCGWLVTHLISSF
jgi:hypothetical protein